MKLDVHQRVIVIHIYFKFHEILSSGSLIMAPDGQMDMDKLISLHLQDRIIKQMNRTLKQSTYFVLFLSIQFCFVTFRFVLLCFVPLHFGSVL